MNIVWLIALGAVVGWLTSYLTKTETGFLGNIILGILGALIGGLIMNAFGRNGVTGFDLYSIIVSVLGAVILVYIGRSIQSIPQKRV
jgi:uncharacterized membrane protein YeaQ/YmgE (transglycosylase-associated protein family)